MGKLLIFVLLLILPVNAFSQVRGGYEIDITLNGLADSTVYLAYHLGDKQYIMDTLKLDRASHAVIDGQRGPAPGNLYDSSARAEVL